MKPLIELDLTLTDPRIAGFPKVPMTLRLYCRPGKPGETMRERMTEAWISLLTRSQDISYFYPADEALLSWAIEQYIALEENAP